MAKTVMTISVDEDIKPLQGFENTYRVRLGKYRLVLREI